MSEQSIRVPVEDLVGFMEDTLEAMGIPADDSKIIADVVITSDLWGIASHGIAHLKMYQIVSRRACSYQSPAGAW